MNKEMESVDPVELLQELERLGLHIHIALAHQRILNRRLRQELADRTVSS